MIAAGIDHSRCLSRTLAAGYDPNWGAGLLGDKSQSMVFDNSKIKRLAPDFVCRIPYSRGAAEMIAWYDADPARRKVNEEFNRTCDRILAAWETVWPR